MYNLVFDEWYQGLDFKPVSDEERGINRFGCSQSVDAVSLGYSKSTKIIEGFVPLESTSRK